MDIELELLILFILQTIGLSLFGKFEGETAWWKRIIKWFFIAGITLTLNHYFGHTGSLLFITFAITASLIFHFTWCKRHGIHPLKATPRKKYYALRNWNWTE